MQTYSNLASDDILKIQADVLTEDISNNSLYMKASTIASKNYQFDNKLGITKKKIIPVINDLAKALTETKTLNTNALKDMYNVLGNIGAYPKLKEAIQNTVVKNDMSAEIGYPTDEETPRPEVTIADIVLDLVKRVEDIENSNNAKIHRDKFNVINNEKNKFILSHIPNVNTIAFYINGIRYFDTYNYDTETNSVTYLADNDLPLKNCCVVIEYQYNVATM
jgi:hypothetical protein